MSSGNDKCFQCQETSHMACYCPYIRCFDCNNYGHVAADCPDKIPPSGTSTQCRDNTSIRHNRSASRNSHTRCSHHDHRDRHRFSWSWSHSYNPRHRSYSHSDPHRSYSRSFHWPSCLAPCITEVPACTATAVTHHTADPHHEDNSPEKAVDPEHISPAGNIINQHKDQFQFANNALET